MSEPVQEEPSFADSFLAENNKDKSPTEIDLHGLFVREAKEKVRDFVAKAIIQRHYLVEIIVGKVTCFS